MCMILQRYYDQNFAILFPSSGFKNSFHLQQGNAAVYPTNNFRPLLTAIILTSCITPQKWGLI